MRAEFENGYITDKAESSRLVDHNGFITINNNPITKEGVYTYLGRSISKDLPQDQLFSVYRPASELAKSETVDSFKLLPWTNDHPTRLLGDPENGHVAPEKKGVSGVIGDKVWFDEVTKTLRGNIKIFANDLKKAISDGKIQLSAGYGGRFSKESGVFDGQSYQFVLRDIMGNHLSSVDEGRTGLDVSVMDSFNFILDASEIKMAEEKNKDTEEKKVMDEEETKTEAEKEAEEKAKAEKEKEVEDEDEEEEEKDDKKDKKDDVMDAAAIAVIVRREVAKALNARPVMDAKDIFKQISERDALASRVSHFVGVFDASDMDKKAVAKYALSKLQITTHNDPIATLEGYLHNRPVPSATYTPVMDAAPDNFVSKFLGATQ